jgi:hypothetical protein
VQEGCTPLRPLSSETGCPYARYMEPLASVNFDSAARRPAGWQTQLRVDFVVNRIMQTHRGRDEEQVAQAIQESLRSVGVVPNGRQIAQYAQAISQLPELPPKKD